MSDQNHNGNSYIHDTMWYVKKKAPGLPRALCFKEGTAKGGFFAIPIQK
jgi:hypothetical protein